MDTENVGKMRGRFHKKVKPPRPEGRGFPVRKINILV
jgi:hypothetical protein